MTTERNWLREGAYYAVQTIYFDQAQGVRYRIISEQAGTPALFQASNFAVIDGSIPESWRAHPLRNGSFELSPAAWLVPGFWERFFDGDEKAEQVFHQYVTPTIAPPDSSTGG